MPHRLNRVGTVTATSLLWASVGALATGPLLAGTIRRTAALHRLLDGLILVSIGGIVLLAVVPHALSTGSPLLVVALGAGFLLPTAAERIFHVGVQRTHAVLLPLALLGVTFHSLLDGGALAQLGGAEGQLLGVGVVLHQLPVSLTTWWLLRDRPLVVSLGVLLLMAVATIGGFLGAPVVAALFPEHAAVWLEAVIGGSLLHVIAHPPHDHAHAAGHGHAHDHDHDHAHAHAHDHGHSHHVDHGTTAPAPRWHFGGIDLRPDGVGALLGLALVVLLVQLAPVESAATAPFGSTFLALALDSAPALVIACVAAGLLHAWFPTAPLQWIGRGGPLRQALAGMVVGLPIPVCSCGVVPLYQGLVRQGVPTAAAIAFLVATPELGLDAIILSVPLLGAPFTAVRVTAAALTAVLVALVMVRTRPSPLRRGLPQAVNAPTHSRWRVALRTGAVDLVDHTAPWVLLGLVVAALAAPLLEGSWVTRMPAPLDVLAFAALGVPLYICASASTPLVAVLVAAGVSPGAGLALLITGPATNVATFGVLSRLHGQRFAVTFAMAMTTVAIGLGLLVNQAAPWLRLPPVGAVAPESHGPVAWGALLIMGMLVSASILRRGPRGFAGELALTPHAHEAAPAS